MTKIYFGNKPVYLTDESAAFMNGDDVFIQQEITPQAIQTLIQHIEKPSCKAAILLHPDAIAAKQAFWDAFTIQKAGGGAVWNDQNQLLFIFRRGKWDLPKGKLEEGESIEACAVREVEEETGIRKPQILKALPTTYHTYYEHGKHILKEAWWFEMKASGPQVLNPQQEEQITETRWLAPSEWEQVRQNSFPSILDVLNVLTVSRSQPLSG